MQALTLTDLNKAISFLGKRGPTKVPYGFNDLLVARAFLLGESKVMPDKDPRDVLTALGWRW